MEEEEDEGGLQTDEDMNDHQSPTKNEDLDEENLNVSEPN